MPAPNVLAYPTETIVAEKAEAMVDLGISNSRMMDFTDVAIAARRVAFEGDIRRRLRALLLRQWKRKRFIVRRLIRLGARASKARHVVYEGRKSLSALSHCSPVDRALNKAYFAERGLFSLEHQYRDLHRVVAPAQMSLALE